RRLALGDVDEVVHHPALAAHDQVEVAQADVEVDHHDLLAAARQAAREAGAAGGLADAALARCDYDDFSQRISPGFVVVGDGAGRADAGYRWRMVTPAPRSSVPGFPARPAPPCRAAPSGCLRARS